MTVFILVSEAHTGGWIWQDVAARLRESGARAHPVTLTGMDGDGDAAGPGTDLETHVGDVLRFVDEAGHDDASGVVLVGHGYGIHPVLGAADRRPARIARVVHLDAGIPGDGDQALSLVPDPAVHERLRHTQGRPADDGPVAPPGQDGWQRWGSLDGVPEEALARLTRRAAPQPAGTLTQPLRLSGAAAEVPSTGILCTANGSDIARVEALVGFGDPRLRALVDPRVTFFELATGHWPMLSVPGELADALLRASAGEGRRLGGAAGTAGELPPHLRPFLMDLPERPRERHGRVDLHLPDADGPRPAVVLVHGGPVPAGARPTPRDWPSFTGYGRYLAGLGAVCATVDHRLHGMADFARAADDVAGTVDLVRADPRVDGDRVALWFFSVGGLLAADWLAAPPAWLRCVAASYPVLAPVPHWGAVEPRFRPATALRTAGPLPVVLTRAGREAPDIAGTVAGFLAAAEECGARVEVVDVPHGRHGFETLDPTEESRAAVIRAAGSVLRHLGLPTPRPTP
ncbi:alpha/beta hydrolase [Streptomyces sp. MI02-7b]|uniref:alpha/beta hydrolase n=1 Tax=Streptomyces sp. MI02-7b TaxID=462941 RepID=UPI0029BC323C|nr:alpha/beta hydrolase [Streptomyces sp. MI02-7b]MDX3075019.1 alpha/beta hydrolase [Streptomyces sp. MI02-7b]